MFDPVACITDFTAPQWEAHPDIDGLEVEIRVHDSLTTLAMLSDVAGETEAERRHQLTEKSLNGAVTSWRGLTVAGLRRLIPARYLKYDGPDEAEIPFTPEMRDILLRLGQGFAAWVLTVVHLRTKEEETITKNSETTPGIIPIPEPGPAKGAGKKKKG